MIARQPSSVLYGGAHLFSVDAVAKLGAIARRSFVAMAPDASALAELVGRPIDAGLAAALWTRISSKLDREPIDDLRIDFEDGFGLRSDEEEDRVAAEVQRALHVMTTRPPWLGIRVRSMTPSPTRALRTLELVLGSAPAPLRVTLPKVESVAEVAAFVKQLDDLEARRGWNEYAIGLELMIETREAIAILPSLIAAGGERLVGLHFGAYDYTASLGIVGASQRLDHPACDAARLAMQLAAPPHLVVVDGATTLLPLAPHRGPSLTALQVDENRRTIVAAARAHTRHILRALDHGIYQGWDLHPAQLPLRYLATYLFYREALPTLAARLKRFIDEGARASRVGAQFDDAATGNGLLRFGQRALAAGAIDDADLLLHGIDPVDLQASTFDALFLARQLRSAHP